MIELFVHCAGNLREKDLSWLEEALPVAFAEVKQRWPESELAQLEEVEVSLVDDETLARLHGEFLDDPSPTDVITFPHGEILVSVEMAAVRADEFGKSELGETFLYVIHGLLHLAGFDDHEAEERRKWPACRKESGGSSSKTSRRIDKRVRFGTA